MSSNLSNLPAPQIIEHLCQFKRSDQHIYLVGGAVRDLLLQRPIHDMDFAVTGNVRRLARKLTDAIDGAFYMLDDQRNTARVIHSPPDSRPIVLDFAALRGEDLESDLRARDFTINAMALDLEIQDQLIDPLGGARDLKDKILRACSADALQSDPLRTLRAVRMALTFQLHIQPATQTAIRQAVPHLDRVSAERQRDELVRILGGGTTASALRLLDGFGILSLLLPELQALKEIAQPALSTPNLWEHTLVSLQELDILFNALVSPYQEDNAGSLSHGTAVMQLGRFRQQMEEHFTAALTLDRSRRSLLFLAALYAGSVYLEEDPHPEEILQQRARTLALSNEEIRYLMSILRSCRKPAEMTSCGHPPGRREIYRFFRDAGEAGLGACLLSLSNTLATYRSALPQDRWGQELQTCRALLEAWWEQKDIVVQPPSLLNGSDLQQQFALSPGPIIGQILEAVRESQAAGMINDRQAALQFCADWLEK